jgi:predicted nucleotidyltransferase
MSEPPADMHAVLARFLASTAPSGLVAAYVFGSHATGRAHRESDVDVAVLLDRAVFPEARERFEERLRLTSAMMRALATSRVDVVVLNDVPPQFGRRIATEGRRVYCADPGQDHAYVRDVQLRAADVEPFLRRMRRLKLDALAR